MLTVLLLAGCSADEEANGIPADEDVLELAVCTHDMEEDSPTHAIPADDSPAFTRAIPTGYSVYPASGAKAEDVSHIGVFMTTEDMTSGPELSNFIYSNINNKWNSLVSVKQGIPYYIYGYMPSDKFTCEAQKLPETQTFADGVVLNFRKILPVSQYDLCFVTGVQDMQSADAEEDIPAGNFSYYGKSKETKNRVRLRLDHLLAGACMEMKIDAEYAKLRDIRLKDVILKTSSDYAWSGKITQRRTYTRVDWQKKETMTAKEKEGVSLFSDADGVSLSATDPMVFYGYCIHEIYSTVVMKSRYDVYDTHGNLIRKDCIAENKLVFPSSMGRRTIFKMTVKPTYVYTLSDPDEKSPTIELEK